MGGWQLLTLTVKVEDKAGNTELLNADTLSHTQIAIDGVSGTGRTSGVKGDNMTNDDRPHFRDGRYLRMSMNRLLILTVVFSWVQANPGAQEAGSISGRQTADGQYTPTVEATDKAGNTAPLKTTRFRGGSNAVSAGHHRITRTTPASVAII